MNVWVILAVVVIVFFGFPLLNNVALPQSFSPDDLGNFVKAVMDYWQSLFNSIIN